MGGTVAVSRAGTTGELAAAHDWRLVPSAVAVWLATLLGLLLEWWWVAVVGVVAVGFGLVLVGVSCRRAIRHIGLSLVVCGLLVGAVGTPRLRAAALDPLRVAAQQGMTGTFTVTVTERPKPVFAAGFGGRPGGVRAVVVPASVRDATVAGRPVASGGAVLLIAAPDGWANLLPGQRVTADAAAAPAERGELTVAVLRVRGPPREVSEPSVAQRVAQSLRTGLRESSAVLAPEPAGLLPALVVGDTDGLSQEVSAQFQDAGMTHLVAVSGSNLAIVCVAVLVLLRAVRVGPKGCALGAMLALAGFVVLAGPDPSVLRAGAMGAIGLLALATGRERAALPALATTVVVLVLVNPALAVSFGFALSVLATAALVLVAPRWAERLAARGVPSGIAQALAVPAAAHLATAPVVAGMSGHVSVVAIVANLLAAPVVGPATVLGVLAALFGPVLPAVAELLVRLAGPEVGWLITVARHASGVPGAVLDWPAGWWGGLLLLGCVAVLMVVWRARRFRAFAAAALVGVVLVVVPVRMLDPSWPPAGWAMVACDVGQGDAVVLPTGAAGEAVLVDTGPEPGPVRGCLDRLDVTGVALVVLSHLHADHIGGLAAVLDGGRVGAVAVGAARQPEWAWARVRDQTSAAGVPVVQLDVGQRMEWSSLRIEVLGPPPAAAVPATEADGTEINNSSVVLRATTSAGRVLLTGDVELSAQVDLLGSGTDLSAEILKVPHHGSRFTSPEFLHAVGARVAVVSVGAGNTYGHPSRMTLTALRDGAAMIVRTDEHGDSAIVAGRTTPEVVTRGDPRAPPGG